MHPCIASIRYAVFFNTLPGPEKEMIARKFFFEVYALREYYVQISR